MLDNIIRIREQHPEESADSFRKKTSNTNQLSQLHQIIDSTHLHMNQMANNILGASESGLENYDSAVINQQIIRQLDATIASLETAYTGKARSFTVVLNEFELLSVQFKSKLDLDVQSGDYVSSEASAGSESGNTGPERENQRMVYVRLFHRNMINLLSPRGALNWMRAVLESVKHSEKHGLAVYAHEEEVKRSLRGENYGYLTVRIEDEQDISDQRAPRHDEQLDCPLLTVAGIRNEDFVKLTYADYDFPIRKGVLYRPKSIMEQD